MEFVLAYIDPGSGSLIIQAIVAAVVAVPFFFRQQIGRVVRAVRGRGSSDKTSGRDDATTSRELPR